MSNVFDKLAQGINKGVATVGTGSKAMIEKARIKTIVKNLEAEKKNLLELLGMKTYEKYTEAKEVNIDESMEKFIVEIEKRIQEISNWQEELQRIDEELNQVTGSKEEIYTDTGENCSCGQMIPKGTKFCVKCGNPL